MMKQGKELMTWRQSDPCFALTLTMPRLKTDTRILGSNGTQVSEVILFKGSAKHQYPHISNVVTLVHFVA